MDTLTSVEEAPWTYSGENAKYFHYHVDFTVPTTRADGSPWAASDNKVVARFYQKTTADDAAGKYSISLLIGGNVTPTYYGTDGRRILKTIGR